MIYRNIFRVENIILTLQLQVGEYQHHFQNNIKFQTIPTVGYVGFGIYMNNYDHSFN